VARFWLRCRLPEPWKRGMGMRLGELGYRLGGNLVLVTRYASPQLTAMEDAIRSLIAEIDLLVAWGTIGAVAAKNVAGSLPVVFFYMGRGGQNAASRVLWEATRSQIDGTEGVYGIPLQELSSAHPESL
jgi:hypothetical protein